MASEVLERSVLPQGKVFIKAGEENARAYIIQNGLVASFMMENGQKIKVNEYGPGTIIGELSLMLDEVSSLSYETLEMTTVATITRPDFQKRLSKTDKTVAHILDEVVKKIIFFENIAINKAKETNQLDDLTIALVRGLTSSVSDDKRQEYENAMTPHINGLIKEIKRLKKAK